MVSDVTPAGCGIYTILYLYPGDVSPVICSVYQAAVVQCCVGGSYTGYMGNRLPSASEDQSEHSPLTSWEQGISAWFPEQSLKARLFPSAESPAQFLVPERFQTIISTSHKCL